MNPIVIKLGGAAGVDAAAVCADVAELVAEGWPLVLAHGTSAAADALAAKCGLPVRHITSPSGHVSRYTDLETLELYVAAAAGQVNKGLVAELQRLGCNAAGLSGVDGRLLMARRKDAVRAIEGGRQRIIRDDYTGQLEAANGDLLRLMLGAGYTPVVAPLALGVGGERLNVDGDRAAAMLAGSLDAAALIILSNVPGLLARFPDEDSLIPHVPAERLAHAEGVAQGRMKKKVLAAREALAGGVSSVVLADSRRRNPIRAALMGAGTVIGKPLMAYGLWPMAETALELAEPAFHVGGRNQRSTLSEGPQPVVEGRGVAAGKAASFDYAAHPSTPLRNAQNDALLRSREACSHPKDEHPTVETALVNAAEAVQR